MKRWKQFGLSWLETLEYNSCNHVKHILNSYYVAIERDVASTIQKVTCTDGAKRRKQNKHSFTAFVFLSFVYMSIGK